MVASGKLHERSERALCRLVFLFVCALPTALTLGLVVWRMTPWHRSAEIAHVETVLRHRLGLDVEIGDMQRVAPTFWQLENLVLRNPETGAEVASITQLMFTQNDRITGLQIDGVTLQTNQLGLVWEVAQDRFLRQPELSLRELRVVTEQLQLADARGTTRLGPVRVQAKDIKGDTEAELTFRLTPEMADQRVQPPKLRVSRKRSTHPMKTEFRLESGSAPLPCSALASYLPVLDRLGSDAQFSGVIGWTESSGDYTVEMDNTQFTHVDMLKLTQELDHPFSGEGVIVFDKLIRPAGEPIRSAWGRITITNAKLDSQLLRRFAFKTGAVVDLDRLNVETRIDCELIAAGFRVNGGGVTTTGLCHLEPGYAVGRAGTAIIAAGQAFLAFDTAQAISGEDFALALDKEGELRLPIGPPQNWTQRVVPPLASRDDGMNSRTPQER